MISTNYDAEADAIYVRIAPVETVVSETQEIEPGVMLDFDAQVHVIGIEILSVRARSTGAKIAA